MFRSIGRNRFLLWCFIPTAMHSPPLSKGIGTTCSHPLVTFRFTEPGEVSEIAHLLLLWHNVLPHIYNCTITLGADYLLLIQAVSSGGPTGDYLPWLVVPGFLKESKMSITSPQVAFHGLKGNA